MGRAPKKDPATRAQATAAARQKADSNRAPFGSRVFPPQEGAAASPPFCAPRPGVRGKSAARVGGRRGGGCGKAAFCHPRPLLLGMRFCEGSGRKCGSKKTGTPNRPLFPPPLDKPRAPKGSSPFGSGNHAPPKRGARRLAAWRNEDGQNRAQRPAPKNKNASPSRRARPCSPVAPSAPKSRFCRTDATAPRR